jgi:hypothetical protein
MTNSTVFAWVHLGPNRIPKYLVKNIERTEEIHPSVKNFIVVDNEKNIHLKIGRNVEVVHLKDTKENWSEVYVRMQHDLKFRSSFWFNSMARFKALALLMERKELKSVIHIESDVVLSKSFPVQTLSNLEGKLAYPFENPQQGIASVLFVGSYGAIVDLVDFCEIRVQSDSKLTDMTALALFRDQYPDKVVVLPTIPNLEGEYSNARYREFTENFETFSGIFDGISLGQYLFGVDSRNNRGFRKVYWNDPNHLFNPSYVSYEWRNGDLYVTDGQKAYKVFNLHIHSKDLRAFKSRKLEKLIIKRISQIKSHPKLEIDLRAFLGALSRSLVRRVKEKIQ